VTRMVCSIRYRTVKDLVAGSGIRFGEGKTVQLKGVPGQWQIYAVER